MVKTPNKTTKNAFCQPIKISYSTQIELT